MILQRAPMLGGRRLYVIVLFVYTMLPTYFDRRVYFT